jgi:hypothetical protein
MFKLTLRELFLLVALVAMACGWLLDHKSHVKLAEECQDWRDLAVGIAALRAVEGRT